MNFLMNQKAERDLPPANTRKVLKRLYGYMTEVHGQFYAMIVLLLLLLASDLAIPLIIETAINAISYTEGISVDFRSLTFSIAVLVFLVLINTGLGCLLGRISARITLKMSMRMRQDAFEKLTDVSVSSFEGMRRGDLMSRIMNDSDRAAGAFTDSFRELFSACLIVIGCAVIMFVKCAPLAAVSVSTALISVFIMGALSGKILPAFTQQQASLGQLNAHAEESLKAFRTCAAGGRMKENLRLMEDYSRDYYRKRLRACRLEYMMGPLMLLFGNLNFLLVTVIGVHRLAAGTITLGAVQAFIMFSRQFMEPLNSLGENFVMVQNALASAERIFEVIDKPGEKTEIFAALPDDKAHNEEKGFLCCRDLHFAYYQNHPVLRGIDLDVREGEHLALVGKTGEGKTTLSNLLLLFFPRYKGNIFLNGRELRNLDPDELRHQVTVVSQEPLLVSGSVLDNLLYGCSEGNPADAERVLREMGAEHFFLNMPQGLDTVIRNNGEDMSQGQLQIICLVRALLRKTPLLILDEATASMDPETELVVRKGMELAMSERTCVIIAHRLSSVKDADRIAVLADGVIAECGTHESLMEKDGIYHKLYETQFLGEEI